MNHHFEKNVSDWRCEIGEERRKIILKEAKKTGKSAEDVIRQWILEYADQIIAESSASPKKSIPPKK